MNFQNPKFNGKNDVPIKKRVNRKPKKVVEGIVAALVAVFVILAAAISILLLYKPTFEDRPSFMTTDFAEQTKNPNVGVVTEPVEPADKIVRNQDQVNFLILGKDRWAYNTDVIIIASYNVADGAISMMQIPRDTYIDIGRGNHKANSLLASFYSEALRNKEKDPQAAALQNLEKALEQVLCITIDYYAMMDLNGFVNIVNALGGVEINVPFDMKYKDPYQNLNINLKKGKQTLNGDQAEQFIRFRADYVEGDIGRVDAQKLFIGACLKKVKNNFNVSTISAIAEQAMQYIKTDIPLQDLVYYAKSAISVDLDKMTMLTLPGIQGRQYESSGTWYYIAYRDGTLSAINKYFNSYFNFEVTADIFDSDHALYDEAGTYMHSIFLTTHKFEESYTPNDTSDIHISKKPVTTAQTTVLEPVTTPAETTAVIAPVETTETADGGVHTDPLDPPTTETGEPSETAGAPEETSVPEETTVVEVTEALEDPEELEEPEETEGSDNEESLEE